MKTNLYSNLERLAFYLVAINIAFGTPYSFGDFSNDIDRTGGFEIGNGIVVNRIGGYRFIAPGKWETGQSGALTQVIAPIEVVIPRPQIQIDIVKTQVVNRDVDSREEMNCPLWVKVSIGGLDGVFRESKTENGLLRSEFRLVRNEYESYLIIVDYGAATNDSALFAHLVKAIDSFRSTDSAVDFGIKG